MSNPKKQPFAFDPLVRRLFDVEAAPTCDKVSQCCPRLCNALHLATLQPSPTKSLEIQKKPAQRTQNGSQSPVLKCTLILVTEWWLANFSDVTLANEMTNMSTTHWVVWVVVINVIWWWKLFGNESPRAPFSVSNFWEIPYWHYCRTVADKCFLQSWAVHNFVIQLITKHSE